MCMSRMIENMPKQAANRSIMFRLLDLNRYWRSPNFSACSQIALSPRSYMTGVSTGVPPYSSTRRST